MQCVSETTQEALAKTWDCLVVRFADAVALIDACQLIKNTD